MAAAVREALAHLGHQAPPREVARFLGVMCPGMVYTEKTLSTTIGNQRKALRADGEARVSQLSALADRLARMGVSPAAMLARIREDDELALSVGSRLQLVECLLLLAGFQSGQANRPAGG